MTTPCDIGQCDATATREIAISSGGTVLEVRPLCDSDTCETLARQTAADFDTTISERIDLGNNESASAGVFPQANGTFLAMTFTRSRHFKTRRGAERWFARATA